MDTVELQHWMHIAATRAAVAAVIASHDLIDKSKRRITEDQRQFQVYAQPKFPVVTQPFAMAHVNQILEEESEQYTRSAGARIGSRSDYVPEAESARLADANTVRRAPGGSSAGHSKSARARNCCH